MGNGAWVGVPRSARHPTNALTSNAAPPNLFRKPDEGLAHLTVWQEPTSSGGQAPSPVPPNVHPVVRCVNRRGRLSSTGQPPHPAFGHLLPAAAGEKEESGRAAFTVN